MSPISHHRFESGFTLVEVMIFVGLTLVTVLAGLSLTNVVQSRVRSSEVMAEIAGITGAIRETLRFRSTCNESILPLNTTDFTDTAILAGTKEIKLLVPGINLDGTPADDIVAKDQIVRKVSFESVKLVNAVNMGSNRYFAQIEATVRDRNNGMSLMPLSLGSIYFSVTGAAITSCETLDTNSTPLCVEMGCTWDPAASPMCKCPALNAVCPPEKFLTGIDADGLPQCSGFGGGPCAAGTYLRGVGIGTSDCVSL